ncbi:hypothetical protein BSKO_07224 [Bryopsis sp. KO-2023]|nr:hypothetical protein BSKO_07224 [Bryopsis sp. KO-2023]
MDDESYDSGEDYYSDYDYDPVDYIGEVSAPETNSSKRPSWVVIEEDTLGKLQNDALDYVMGIMGCTRSACRSLLIHFRWDKEALMCSLAEREPEKIYQAAGVTSKTEVEEPTVIDDKVECGSCLSTIRQRNCTTMECGHIFCNDCWRRHAEVQIADGNSRRLKCMAFRCGAICDEDKIEKFLVGNPEALTRYRQSLLESYIEDNQNVRWCPSVPHCGRAIQVDGDHYCEPDCACGLKFCFKCGNEPHSPSSCEMWRHWCKKCEDDSETRNWLTANTKPCPKCTNPVEKNGGCNLVVCRCGQAFCWLCGASTGTDHTWSRIYGHECGRWKDDMDKKIDEAQRYHKRYMFYFERWKGHKDSLQKEDEQRASVLKSIEKLERADDELHDYSWVTAALDKVLVARRILSNSYVFAYFMFGNEMFRDEITEDQNKINQNLFEDQQQMLEQELERVSGLIQEAQSSANKRTDLRMLVINSKDSIEKRMINLYKTIEGDILTQLSDSCGNIAPYIGK